MTELNQDFNVHVRFDGRSYEFTASQLDIGDLSSDGDVLGAVAVELNLTQGDLDGYEVDRHENGNLTVHPQAVFGSTEILESKTKQEIQEILLEAYANNDLTIEVWQKRPYTAVRLAITDDYDPIVPPHVSAFGFSKACWPDKWDADYGVDLCVKKAIADIGKRFGVPSNDIVWDAEGV